MRKAKRLKNSNLDISFYLWIFSVIQVITYLISTEGIGYPILKYLFGASDRFKDSELLFNHHLFSNAFDIETLSNPNTNIGSSVFVLILAKFCYPFLSLIGVDFYLYFNLLIFVATLFLFFKVFGKKLYILPIAFSHFIIFSFGRGNWALIATLLLVLGIESLRREKYLISSFCFALASFYEFPYILFALLIFFAGKIRFFLLSVGTVVSMYLLGWLLVGSDLKSNFQIFVVSHQRWHDGYVIGDNGLLHNNSIFGGLKTATYLVLQKDTPAGDLVMVSEFLANFVNFLIVVLGVILVWFYFRKWQVKYDREFNYAEYFLLLGLLTGLFLPVAPDYKLIPLCFALMYLIKEKSTFLSKSNLLLLLILFTPKYFVLFYFPWWEPGVTISTLLNPILSSILLIKLVMFMNTKRSQTLKPKKN